MARRSQEEIEISTEEEMKERQEKKHRGVFEKIAKSGQWWVRYADEAGRIRREKVGNRGAALQLYQKRKTQVLQGEKLPGNFRAESVLFSEIADNALAWAKTHKLSYGDDVIRMKRILEAFKSRPA